MSDPSTDPGERTRFVFDAIGSPPDLELSLLNAITQGWPNDPLSTAAIRRIAHYLLDRYPADGAWLAESGDTADG